jgi:Skp family chaperone for outer membrane proteins
LKTTLKHLATASLCLALAGLGAPLAAQEVRREARIVVVNVERLLSESAYAQAVAKRIESDFGPRRLRIQAELRRLREISDKLAHDAPQLSEREHIVRAREVGELERNVRREQAKFQEDLAERKLKERARMVARINEIITTIRQQQGIELVLTRTVWHRPDIDVTDKVARMLDKSVQ